MILLLLASVTAGAQVIDPGSLWYDGWNCYSAIVERDGAIVMQAMSEGQELEFQMFPIEGERNAYTVAKGGNEYADMPFPEGYTMKYRHQEGMKVLCVYNLDNKLETVMIWTPDDCLHNNIWTWIPQIKGMYSVEPDGYRLTIGDLTETVEGMEGTYKVETFNDMVNGVIKVSHEWVYGYYQMKPTLEGFNVYQGYYDEYGHFEKYVEPVRLVECDPDKGRFDFASTLLLTKAALGHYKVSTLRIMRNEILARHGYSFQSQDLKDYFGKQAWYQPAESNSDIKLSFIEQLNVEMIKTAESEADHDEYVWEE